MQDSAPGWTTYLEHLEAQATSLRRRRSLPPEEPRRQAPALSALIAQLRSLLQRGRQP